MPEAKDLAGYLLGKSSMKEMATFWADPDAVLGLKPGLPTVNLMRVNNGIVLTTADHHRHRHTAWKQIDSLEQGMGRGGMSQVKF